MSSLKKLLLVGTALFLVLHASTAQLAFIVLNTASWSLGRLPADWQIKVNHGRPEITLCKEIDGSCLRLKSVKASFALEHGVDIDPVELPHLTWRWKVAQLPGGGDFRKAATDDQAAQLMVAFEDRRVISYIWDSSAPKGLLIAS